MSPIERLQSFIFARLSSLAYFHDVGVYLHRPRLRPDGTVELTPEITARIEQLLNGVVKKDDKAGAAVIVLLPTLSVDSPDVPGPEFKAKTLIRVQENTLINMSAAGTRKSAEEIALEVARGLHQWVPTGISTQLSCTKDAIRWNQAQLPKWTYDVEVETRFSIDPPTQVARPVIAVAGAWPDAVVTLTCPTDGASIYYTLDGSLPYLGNPAAVLYAAPFTVAQPGVVYAAAYMANRAGSYPSFAEIEAQNLQIDTGENLTDDQGNPLHFT